MTDKLAKNTEGQFGILAVPEAAKEITAALRENVGDVSLFDLAEIPMPAGGGTTWEITTLTDSLAEKRLPGVILVAQDVRAYYSQSFEETGGQTPPDCSSPDGVTGFGSPGGACAQCAFAQFGSGKEGRGQACQQRKQLLLLTPFSNLPFLLSVPPTSLKNLRQYLLALAGESQAYWGCVTALTLEKAANPAGIEYAKVRFAFDRALSPEEKAVALGYRESLQGLLASAPAAG